MRDPNPQPGGDQYEGFRYNDEDHGDRYHEMRGRDVPTAEYNFRPVTLEEEAYNGGWLPGARPTSTKPDVQGSDPRLSQSTQVNDLYTVGMRGEPGWDDDPQFNNGAATVTHPPGK